MFRYLNMDHAIESGIKAAEAVIKNDMEPEAQFNEEVSLAGCEG